MDHGNILIAFAFVLVAAILGAIHRIALGGKLRRPYATAFGFAVYGIIIYAGTGNPLAAAIVSGITQALWALGHGDGIDMGTMPQQGKDWLRPVVDWLFGTVVEPNTSGAFWRDFTHMVLRYGIQTSAMAMALWPFGVWAPWLAPIGLLGGPCYALTRTKMQSWFPAINVGEPAIGAVLAGGLALAIG